MDQRELVVMSAFSRSMDLKLEAAAARIARAFSSAALFRGSILQMKPATCVSYAWRKKGQYFMFWLFKVDNHFGTTQNENKDQQNGAEGVSNMITKPNNLDQLNESFFAIQLVVNLMNLSPFIHTIPY